jgi:hypothetical protein
MNVCIYVDNDLMEVLDIYIPRVRYCPTVTLS